MGRSWRRSQEYQLLNEGFMYRGLRDYGAKNSENLGTQLLHASTDL